MFQAQFAKGKGLAGAVFWTIDTDDFLPTCGSNSFGIVNTVKDVFNNPSTGDPIVSNYIMKLPSIAAQIFEHLFMKFDFF